MTRYHCVWQLDWRVMELCKRFTTNKLRDLLVQLTSTLSGLREFEMMEPTFGAVHWLHVCTLHLVT